MKVKIKFDIDVNKEDIEAFKSYHSSLFDALSTAINGAIANLYSDAKDNGQAGEKKTEDILDEDIWMMRPF